MSGRLVVPIDVEALCVGRSETAQTLGPLADFSRLAQPPYLGRAVRAGVPRAPGPGVHVHWALPDGLTSGIQDSSGAVTWPAVPNRWLVTRIVMSATGAASYAGWVLDSDLLSSAPPTVTVPGDPPDWYTLGGVTPVAQWSEQPAAQRMTPLTAVGYGEPTFAAFYPNCAGVFGLYDPLPDVSGTATLAYHVAGWYAGAAADPLAGGTLDPGQNPFRWWFPAGASPTATLCDGIVHGIAWDPARSYLSQSIDPPTLALGSSTAEALSALLAAELPDLSDAEATLNALQFGYLGREQLPGALERFEETVHAAGFKSLPGGSVWAIRAAEDDDEGTGETVGDEITLPDALATALDALNLQQAAYDAAVLALADQRRRLFADWCRYLDLAGAPGVQAPDPALAEAWLGQAATAVTAAAAALAAAAGTLGGALGDLAEQLEPPTVPREDPLAPRYHAPAEPVLVLHGPAAQPAVRYGRDGAGRPDGYLACRRDSDLVSMTELQPDAVGGNSAAASVTTTALPGLPTPPPDAPPEVKAALADAIALAPTLQPIIAAAAAAQGGAGNPATTDFAATVGVLAAGAGTFVAGQPTVGVAFAGLAPDPLALTASSGAPWLPIMLQWTAQLAPLASGSYPSDVISGHFALDRDAIDLEASTPPSAAPIIVSGSALLSADAAADLAQELSGVSDPEVQRALAQLQAQPLLAQALTGLNDALLMRDDGLQLPVAAPGGNVALAATVAAAVASENTTAPLPSAALHPLRAGALTLKTLRLIDAFGQYRDFTGLVPRIASGLAASAGGAAFLPPRITQPARLLFRWRAAVDDNIEMNNHPATSPVIGWVVPDYLDDAVVIYDAGGNAVAELGLGADRESVLFTPAPGGPFAAAATPQQVFAGEAAHLREFALGLYNAGDAAVLDPFLQSVRTALATSLPASFKEDVGMALLLGQPLALTRASLQLQLSGAPATDQSWADFLARIRSPQRAPATAGLEQIQFPVAVGSRAQLDDTLIACWAQSSGGATNFGAPLTQPLLLTPGADPVTVTLLLDPRGCVHATTGVLPVKSIAIPPDQFAGALARVAVSFAAHPLLTDSVGPPSLPLPAVVEGAWSWIAATRAGWATDAVLDAPLEATLDDTPQRLLEGWLRLNLASPHDD